MSFCSKKADLITKVHSGKLYAVQTTNYVIGFSQSLLVKIRYLWFSFGINGFHAIHGRKASSLPMYFQMWLFQGPIRQYRYEKSTVE